MLGLAFVAAFGCDGSGRSPAVGAAGSFAAGAGGTSPDSGAGGQGGVADTSDASTTPSNGGSNGGSGGGSTLPDAGEAGDAGVVDPVDGGPGDAGGGEEVPAVWSCDGDYAYGASAELVFMEPTPVELGNALTTIKGATHPISLVLHLEESGLMGALSATTEDVGGQDIFPPDNVPPFAPAVEAFGSPPGVTSADPQPNATLHFEDEAGPLDIQLEHIVWRATQGSSCADMTVSIQAVIPTSQFSLVVHLPSGDQTIGELISASSSPGATPIGGSGPPTLPVEIAATFEGVPLDFDFETL